MIRVSKPARPAEVSPQLPLNPSHWDAIFAALQLSPQQAKVVELLLRGLGDKQIAAAMGIGEPTVRTYLDRIWERTGAHGRMELAMRVLAVSHAVTAKVECPRKQ
jgi:DNA-binding NarL/FixJ family response regulator